MNQGHRKLEEEVGAIVVSHIEHKEDEIAALQARVDKLEHMMDENLTDFVYKCRQCNDYEILDDMHECTLCQEIACCNNCLSKAKIKYAKPLSKRVRAAFDFEDDDPIDEVVWCKLCTTAFCQTCFGQMNVMTGECTVASCALKKKNKKAKHEWGAF